MKIKYVVVFLAVFLATFLLTFQVISTSKKQSSKKVDFALHKERIEIYLQKSLNLPSHISVKVGEVKDTKANGLKILQVKFEDRNNQNIQNTEYVITDDYKYIILGQLLNTEEDPYQEKMKKIEISERPTKGNKNAKITMVVYSDFQCPYCVKMIPIEEEILKLYPGKVKIVFKNFPLDRRGAGWAREAAIWSLCAFSQNNNKFWKLHDFLFQKQQEITKENLKEKVIEFCKNEDINISQLQNCYDNKLTENILNKDMEEAAQVGVRSIPTSIVQGKTIVGAQSLETFREVIDRILKE